MNIDHFWKEQHDLVVMSKSASPFRTHRSTSPHAVGLECLDARFYPKDFDMQKLEPNGNNSSPHGRAQWALATT